MSPVSRKEYLQAIVPRYQQAGRAEKTRILDEFCATCGYHRKAAIRRLRRALGPAPIRRRKPGRPSRYDTPAIRTPLQRIWQTAHYPCSTRLKAILPCWLGPYQTSFGPLAAPVRHALQAMAPATIDRLLRRVRVRSARHARAATKPGRLLRHQLPIRTHQWDEARPGFLEADTVAHCGMSLAGEFVYTLDTTDLATGWTEQRAVWGKGETAVLAQIQAIEAALPFALRGFDCDNGSEFLNWHLLGYCQGRRPPIEFTRSRAYHKDDNAHIEQKNWTHVRQWLGYQRFDDPRLVELLNDLYTSEWRLLHNFFLPSVKLLAKRRVGSTIVKVYDGAKTPYHRLLNHRQIPRETKLRLIAQYRTLNPFTLRQAVDAKIRRIQQLAR
jgi:hypothetical protein